MSGPTSPNWPAQRQAYEDRNRKRLNRVARERRAANRIRWSRPGAYDDIDLTRLKRCYICGKKKPLSEFCKERARGDGFCSRCKGCDRQADAEGKWKARGASA